MQVNSNWYNLVLRSTCCLICQLGSAIPQRSAIINTNAIIDNATVDHPPPYDQLKNTSSFQLKNVKTNKAMTTRMATCKNRGDGLRQKSKSNFISLKVLLHHES